MRKEVCLGFVFFAVLSLCSAVIAQDAPTRRFKGSGTINLGKYEDFYLRVLTGYPIIYATPGETVEFKIFVRRGDLDAVLHDVRVIDDNERFTLRVEPESIDEITNIQMHRLQAWLTVPDDMPIGDYPLRIRVAGKEFVEESYPIDTRIHVRNRHTAALLDSVLLAIAGLLVLIVVWRIINIKKLGK
jgi:uncharacterized membrane protein